MDILFRFSPIQNAFFIPVFKLIPTSPFRTQLKGSILLKPFQNSSFSHMICVLTEHASHTVFILQDYNTSTPLMLTTLLRFAAITFFPQIECFCQPCTNQVYQHHFSKSMCSPPVSVSHFGNSHNISSFFIIIIFIMMICDQ